MLLQSTPPRVRGMASHQHRVLIYTTCYNILDGVTLTIRKLEQEILKAGHSVCILTTLSGDPAHTHMHGEHPNRTVIFMDNAIPIPFLRDPNSPELIYQIGFSLSKAVKEQLEAFEPSIIHITCPDNTALHLIQYARQRELPIMGTYHSNIPEYMAHYPGLSWLKHILGHFFRHEYNFLQALYVPTPYIVRHLEREWKMDRCTNMVVWGRGVDIQAFDPRHASDKFRASLGVNKTTPIVLWVGRLVPEKRVDIFCEIVQRLAQQGIDFHAVVVGAGPCQDEIERLPKTTFCGWMDADPLAIAYASSDVFLFPSSVETFGNVTLEAAASGLPVVVEAGCSGHLVRDNGFGIDAGDVDGFYQATLQLVTDRDLRVRQSRASRRMAEQLEQSTVVREMLQHYSHITDEFYCVYGGRHANRDLAYTQTDSFVSGNHPRPLLFVTVEYLFIVLFQVIWKMTTIFMCMQESIMVRHRSSPLSPTTEAAPLLETEDEEDVLSVILEAPSFSEINEDSSIHGAALPATGKGTLVDWSRQDSNSGPTVIDLDDVELDEDDVLLAKTTTSDLDDATDSTASSSQDTVPPTTVSPLSCCHSPNGSKAFGDCELSHTLAKSFVHSLAFQMRLESCIRNSCASCCSSTTLLGVAKRKNSSFALSTPELGRPELMHRGRSDVSEVVELTGVNDTSPLTPEDKGHRLRRSLPLDMMV